MKLFVRRIAAVSVAALCLCNRSEDFSKLRVTGAARRVLGILMTAILGVVLSAQPVSAAVTFSNVADTTTTAPGHGAFTSFGSPSVSGSNLAFFGGYSGGNGIYTGSVGAMGAVKVVDPGDTAPGHGAFTVFNGLPSVSGSNVAFLGGYSGGTGLYTGSVGATGAAKVVDFGDTAPGHGAFNGFFVPSVSGGNVAFFGTYSSGGGIYTGSVGATGAAKVVDLGDTAPGHGAFTGFGSAPSISGSNVAFFGGYSGGTGLYLATGGAGGSLSAVLNTGDALFGSTVSSFNVGRIGYDNNAIAFEYTLADGRNGIGVATIGVPEPDTGVLGVVAAGLMWCWRKRFK